MIIRVITFILAALTCVLFFVYGFFSIREEKMEREEEKRDGAVKRLMKKSRIRALDYDEVMAYLTRTGYVEMFESITPPIWLLARAIVIILCFFAGFFLCTKFDLPVVLAVLFAFGGYFLPILLGSYINSKDNDDMLMDIKNLYDTMKVQTKAGMYLSNSLCECYRVVSNSRLKKALLELNARLLATNNIEEALDEFNAKFDNDYVNTFCITIRQAQKSGQSVQILNDVANQMKDVQHVINKRREEAMDTKVNLLEILISLIVMGILVAAFITTMSGTMSM